MNLPIDVVPGTSPPRFRWRQEDSTPVGDKVVEHEGSLPPAIEAAVARLVEVARQLLADKAGLQKTVNELADRVAAQSDILTRRAELPTAAPRKGRVQ